VEVGEALHGIGKGLLVDLGVVGLDAVADCPIVYGSKHKTHDISPMGLVINI
jgi:hypothetical protein